MKGEETAEKFSENKFQKVSQKEIRIEKIIKRKMINYMLNGKFAIHLVVGLIKKILLYKNELFCIYVHSKNKIEIELNLSNYATKSDLNNASDMDTSQFANLKLEADK